MCGVFFFTFARLNVRAARFCGSHATLRSSHLSVIGARRDEGAVIHGSNAQEGDCGCPLHMETNLAIFHQFP